MSLGFVYPGICTISVQPLLSGCCQQTPRLGRAKNYQPLFTAEFQAKQSYMVQKKQHGLYPKGVCTREEIPSKGRALSSRDTELEGQKIK